MSTPKPTKSLKITVRTINAGDVPAAALEVISFIVAQNEIRKLIVSQDVKNDFKSNSEDI